MEAGGDDTDEIIEQFINGKAYFIPKYYGVGYVGELGANVDYTSAVWYSWTNMLYRCYRYGKYYGDVTVCPEWLNFSNYYKWYMSNHYMIEDESVAVDKDILFPGNRVYSPDRCLFVPVSINSMFTEKNQSLTKDKILERVERYVNVLPKKVYDALIERAEKLDA